MMDRIERDEIGNVQLILSPYMKALATECSLRYVINEVQLSPELRNPSRLASDYTRRCFTTTLLK